MRALPSLTAMRLLSWVHPCLFSSPLFTWLSFMMDSKFQWYVYTFCKDWCWSWNSNTLSTWWEELTHFKRPWCWERLMAGGEGDSRGWDSWMASPAQWTWVWVNSWSWWWTGRPGVLWFMGSQRVGHDWVTELNCISALVLDLSYILLLHLYYFYLKRQKSFSFFKLKQSLIFFHIFSDSLHFFLSVWASIWYTLPSA